MMTLATTAASARWLFEQRQLVEALTKALLSIVGATESAALRKGILAVDAFRIAQSTDGAVIVVWNVDFTASGSEDKWVLVDLDGQFGLLRHPRIMPEVLERMLEVGSSRLTGLLIKSDFRVRENLEGVHSCIAGRGAEAYQNRVAYTENSTSTALGTSRAVAFAGPDRESPKMLSYAKRTQAHVSALVHSASGVVSASVKRPVLEPTSIPGGAELTRLLSPQPAQVDDSTPLQAVAAGCRDLTYTQWVSPDSPLNPSQRRILESDAIEHRPLRIIGAAGSGKTLLMQLLAIRRLEQAENEGTECRILYLAHNGAMSDSVFVRFIELGAERFLQGLPGQQALHVTTLLAHARATMGADEVPVYDEDAHSTKVFQRECVSEALKQVMQINADAVKRSKLLSAASENAEARNLLVTLIVDEISVAIKGNGLSTDDEQRYVFSERSLSRLHAVLTESEREFVFQVFRQYHEDVFEDLELLDIDDVALSLLQKLTTPIWQRQRRKAGFDFVLVDETQLFNENERRIFAHLTRGSRSHLPIVLAADEAQQVRGGTTAGLGLLGLGTFVSEKLVTVHRCAPSVLNLAFFVIQRTTDLFGPDFPDFSKSSQSALADDQSDLPTWWDSDEALGKATAAVVRHLRKKLRTVAVVCHADRYWNELEQFLLQDHQSLVRLTQRGRDLRSGGPLVVLARPDAIGGQEFDAVVLIGLEQGVVPSRVPTNPTLSAALEQQALREIYVAITRARTTVAFVSQSSPNRILADAIAAKKIARDSIDSISSVRKSRP